MIFHQIIQYYKKPFIDFYIFYIFYFLKKYLIIGQIDDAEIRITFERKTENCILID